MKDVYINCQVEKAGYFYIGHFNSGRLQIDYGGGSIVVTNTENVGRLLHGVFDIDSENGVFFDDIKGKYFRLLCDEHYNVISIGHIIKDLFIPIEDLTSKR